MRTGEVLQKVNGEYLLCLPDEHMQFSSRDDLEIYSHFNNIKLDFKKVPCCVTNKLGFTQGAIMIIQHAAASSAKTTGGGIAVAAVSYVGTEKFIQALPEPSAVAQATEIATLVAAICTAVYFLGMAIVTWVKIYKEAKK